MTQILETGQALLAQRAHLPRIALVARKIGQIQQCNSATFRIPQLPRLRQALLAECAILESYLLALFRDVGGTIVKAANSRRRLVRMLDNPLARGHWELESSTILRWDRAECHFMSAAPTSNIVGAAADVLLELDEAQDMTAEKIDRDLLPMASSTNATRVYYGTAWDTDNPLEVQKRHNLELQARDGIRRHFEYDWTVLAAVNKPLGLCMALRYPHGASWDRRADVSMAFLLTTLIIVATPGTGVLYTLAASLSRGTRASIIAAVGCTLGIVPPMVAAITGLAALLHASAPAFQSLRYLGVAYLLFTAWRTLRDTGALPVEETAPRSATKVIISGILINILNPKLTIFFFAFLPQFVGAHESSAWLHMLELSAVFMLVTFVVFVVYGVFAASVRQHVVSRPRVMTWLRRVFAGSFVALGVRLALPDR